MKIRKKLCLFLSVLLTTGTAAVPAHTLEAGSPGSLTESFIDEATGREMNRKTFLDVAREAWFYKELEMCYNIGMVEGIGEHRFNPNAPVTRAEAVSLINRMRNRSITAEELNRLGVENPYTDLVETYWAYGDLLEATVKHSAADWHKLNFSGTVNQVTERFVDENGSEIAEAVANGGAENHAYKDVKNFRYMGYAACSVSDKVLHQCLQDNPNIKNVSICFDSDEPGQFAAQRITAKLVMQNIESEILVPVNKDWNEDLLSGEGLEVGESCQILRHC